MNVYTISELLATLDSIALQYERLADALGTGTEDGSVSKACKTNFQRQTDLTNLVDKYLSAKSLLDYSGSIYRKFVNDYIHTYYRDFLSEINRLENINTILTTNDDRIHPNVKTLCSELNITISPANVMPPPIETDNAMGKYDIAEGTGTFTDGDDIDITQYGKALLKVKTLSIIGAENLVLTITCKKIDNSTVDKEVTIPTGTEAGVEFTIGAGTKTDMFIDITAITHTTGSNGDSVKVISKWERTLAE